MQNKADYIRCRRTTDPPILSIIFIAGRQLLNVCSSQFYFSNKIYFSNYSQRTEDITGKRPMAIGYLAFHKAGSNNWIGKIMWISVKAAANVTVNCYNLLAMVVWLHHRETARLFLHPCHAIEPEQVQELVMWLTKSHFPPRGCSWCAPLFSSASIDYCVPWLKLFAPVTL